MKKPVRIWETMMYNGTFKAFDKILRGPDGHRVHLEERETFSDAHIEYWAEVYLRNAVASHGVLFEYFLINPQAVLFSIDDRDPIFRPLLPAQERVQRRLDLQMPLGELEELKQQQHLERAHQVVNRNGMLFEPMKHHSWPRRPGRAIA